MDMGRVRRAVVFGGLIGLVYGALQVADDGSLVKGVVSGVLFGLMNGVIAYVRPTPPEHLADLTPANRRKVFRAVRRGEVITDPLLAPAVVRQAQLMEGGGDVRAGRVLALALLALSLLGIVFGIGMADPGILAASSFATLLWVLVLAFGPKMQRRFEERARVARAAAEKLLER